MQFKNYFEHVIFLVHNNYIHAYTLTCSGSCFVLQLIHDAVEKDP